VIFIGWTNSAIHFLMEIGIRFIPLQFSFLASVSVSQCLVRVEVIIFEIAKQAWVTLKYLRGLFVV